MKSVPSRSRGISPVVGVILLVAVVLLLSAVTVAMVSGFGTDEEPPSAAFEAEAGQYLTIRHASGDQINSERLSIKGGDEWMLPSELSSGTEMSVQPDSGADEISLVWEGEDQSYILQTFDVTQRDVSAGPEPMPSQPTDCVHYDANPVDGSNIEEPGRCVVIEEGASITKSITARDIYIQSDATVSEPVDPSGNITLRTSAELSGNINTGSSNGKPDNLFVGTQATVDDAGSIEGVAVVRDGGTIDSNLNNADEVYLLPGAYAQNTDDADVYYADDSQVGTANGDENKIYD